MSTDETADVCFTVEASNVAFRVGQLLERLLSERGLELARSTGASAVTPAMIEACIRQLSLEDFRNSLDERSRPQPREAA